MSPFFASGSGPGAQGLGGCFIPVANCLGYLHKHPVRTSAAVRGSAYGNTARRFIRTQCCRMMEGCYRIARPPVSIMELPG
ncbi:hypothetical protein [Xanthomonas fragariae]|uniref:hypothetical protein n=1 Tax=Xanthomonas fragariae TaxID=48664 RepID=UPI0022AB1DAA|nr:hypothetical protein [Xanthomonas fragariae]WAT14153.1 hypothetical protein OZ429_13875 [Xanthomonas fragariae]